MATSTRSKSGTKNASRQLLKKAAVKKRETSKAAKAAPRKGATKRASWTSIAGNVDRVRIRMGVVARMFTKKG